MHLLAFVGACNLVMNPENEAHKSKGGYKDDAPLYASFPRTVSRTQSIARHREYKCVSSSPVRARELAVSHASRASLCGLPMFQCVFSRVLMASAFAFAASLIDLFANWFVCNRRSPTADRHMRL